MLYCFMLYYYGVVLNVVILSAVMSNVEAPCLTPFIHYFIELSCRNDHT
jgi:hypothetical protein